MRDAVAPPDHTGASSAEGCPATAEKLGRSLGVAAACRPHPQAQPRQPLSSRSRSAGWAAGCLEGPDQGTGGTQPPGGGLAPCSLPSLLL